MGDRVASEVGCRLLDADTTHTINDNGGSDLVDNDFVFVADWIDAA